jgi:hypothetical protein
LSLKSPYTKYGICFLSTIRRNFNLNLKKKLSLLFFHLDIFRELERLWVFIDDEMLFFIC